MGEILLIRHGETEWNRLQKYQGISDIPLNLKGEEQARTAAREIAKYLQRQGIRQHIVEQEEGESEREGERVVLYASTLSRAQMTAEIIGEAIGVQIRLDRRLREVSFGLWEGMTFSEVYEQYQKEFDQWYADPMSYEVPSGETLNEVLGRSKAALVEISERHPASTIIVVTHGGVIKTLLQDIEPEYQLWNQHVAPCSITKIAVFPGK